MFRTPNLTQNRSKKSIKMNSFRKIKIVLSKNILENYNLYFSKLYRNMAGRKRSMIIFGRMNYRK